MYKVEIVARGGYAFLVKSRDYEFVVDIKGKGITPPDTFLAGLGSCVGVYARKYAEGAGLDLGEFTVNVEAEFDPKPPVSFRRIDVGIDLKGAKIDDLRQKALVDFVNKCPIKATLDGKPAVAIKISRLEF